MFALAQIITILFNCPETECNFLVLKVGSKLIFQKTAEDMGEVKRNRDESKKKHSSYRRGDCSKDWQLFGRGRRWKRKQKQLIYIGSLGGPF